MQPAPPKNADEHPKNLDWQWLNNSGSVIAAINMLRIGNKAAALAHLCDGQRHNPSVVVGYRAFPEEAFAYVLANFAPRVPCDTRRISAPMPWTLSCGHANGECVGGHVGDVHQMGPVNCLLCNHHTISTRHIHSS